MRTAIPPCRCGASEWIADVLGDLICQKCDTTYVHRCEDLRARHEGKWSRGQRFYCFPSDDPDSERTLITFWMGHDDQRPEHEPKAGYFRPLTVAELLPGGTLYGYVRFCGKCRRKWGSLGASLDWSACPYCGAGIATYVFRDGVLASRPGPLPDHWPEECVALWERE